MSERETHETLSGTPPKSAVAEVVDPFAPDPHGNMRVFGRAIYNRRVAEEQTQDEVAAARGKSQGWLSRIEAGEREPSFDDLIWLCNYFGLTIPFGKIEDAMEEGKSLGFVLGQMDSERLITALRSQLHGTLSALGWSKEGFDL